tara:strand:- start:148 stop:666 length:519 start_codon:yes stop_codon:yes gene_type:complete
MGQLIGFCIKHDFSDGCQRYLSTYVEDIQKDIIDFGEPIPYAQVEGTPMTKYEHAGWTWHIKSSIPNYRLDDDPIPDPYYKLFINSDIAHESKVFSNTRDFDHFPGLFVPAPIKFEFDIEIWEDNFIDDNHLHGYFAPELKPISLIKPFVAYEAQINTSNVQASIYFYSRHH